MGLSICRSIIEDHNGRLWVEPNKPAGAIFQFTLRVGGATSAASRIASYSQATGACDVASAETGGRPSDFG
jgi:hypothetical protein